jgi:hypothetical protein
LSHAQIDDATVTSWRKVALVVTVAQNILVGGLPEDDTGPDLIAERIEVLVQDGRLLAQGNIKRWRYSEVRKPESHLRVPATP